MAQVLTRPVSTGGIPGDVIEGVTVPDASSAPNNVQVVDSVSTAEVITVKWIYTITDDVNNETLTAEVLATHRNNGNQNHNRYAIVGDRINHRLNVNFNAGDLELEITNQTLNDFRVNVVRIETPNS